MGAPTFTSMTHASERMDRTAFASGKHEDVARVQRAARRAMTPSQRLEAAWVRTCRVYGIDPYDPPPMRKDVFAMRKQPR